MRARSRFLLVGAALLQPGVLRACTVCGTATGTAVRSGVFDGHFVANLFQLAAPFPALLAVTALVCRWLPLAEPGPATDQAGVR